MRNKEIIYIDETSTNLWEKRAKLWQPKDKSLPMVIQKTRDMGSNVTIIGGISLKMEKMFFQLVNTTNKENVENFFKKFHN